MSRDHSIRNLSRYREEFDLRESSEDGALSDDYRTLSRASAGTKPTGESRMAPTVTDTVQNTRLDALERALRDLTEDIALNRQAFNALLEQLRGGVVVSDPEPAPEPEYPVNGGIPDDHNFGDTPDLLYLIGRLERSIDAKFSELVRTWGLLGKRIDGLEEAVENIDVGELGDLEERLKRLLASDGRFDRFEALLSALPQRLEGLEARLGKSGSPADMGPVLARFAEMERRLQAAIEAADYAPIYARIETMQRAMENAPAGAVELGPILTEIREVASRTGDANLLIDSLSERFERIEDAVEQHRTQLRDAMASVGGEPTQAMLENALRNVAHTFERQKEEISESVTRVVSDRLSGLSGGSEMPQMLSALQARMVSLEEAFTSLANRPIAVTGGGDGLDNAFVTNAMNTIVNNQKALATSIDDWRAEAKTDITQIRSRLEMLETSQKVTLPPEFDSLNKDIRDIRDKISDRSGGDAWTRFRLWLYGTNDWYGASWGGASEEDEGWLAYRRRRPVPRQAQPHPQQPSPMQQPHSTRPSIQV